MMALSDRAERLEAMRPHLVADILLYDTRSGGRRGPALPGFGCLCVLSQDAHTGYDAWLLLGDQPLPPGQRQRIGLVFLTIEGAEAMRDAGMFFLRERRIIGEASVVEDRTASALAPD